MTTLTSALQCMSSLKASCKLFQIEQMNQSMDCLYKTGNEWTERLKGLSEEQMRRLGEENNPLPLAIKSLEILSSDSLQWSKEAKYSFSKVCRVFLDLCWIRSTILNESIYAETRQRFLDQIKKVCSTIRHDATQAKTYFELQSCKGAVRALVPGSGKWREVAKDHALPLAEGFVKALLSISLVQPASCLVPLVSPIFRLCIRMYQERELKWRGEMWTLRWSFTCLTKLEQFDQPEIQGLIKGAKEHHRLAFSLTEIFFEMIEKGQEKPLKKRVFESLVVLADLAPEETVLNRLRKDKFWRVRYRAIEHMQVLFSQPDYQGQIISKLLQRLAGATGEKEPRVAALVQKVCRDLAPRNAAQLQNLAGQIKMEEVKQQHELEKAEVEGQKNSVRQRKEHKHHFLRELFTRKHSLKSSLEEGNLEANTEVEDQQTIENQIHAIEQAEQALSAEITALDQQELQWEEDQKILDENFKLLESILEGTIDLSSPSQSQKTNDEQSHWPLSDVIDREVAGNPLG